MSENDIPDVKYKIIEIHPDQHSIVVRYYTDKVTENDLATSYINDENGNKIVQTKEDGSPIRCQTDYNINIWKIPAPSEDEIKNIISLSAPFDWFRLKHLVLDPNADTSLNNVNSLLDKEFIAIKPQTESSLANTNTGFSEEEIDLLIKNSQDEIEQMIVSIIKSSNSENTSANTQ